MSRPRTLEHVAVAGAGIIGLALALELRRRGLDVTVLERGRPMGEASWAAAGMLAVHDPENPASIRPLSELSAKLYPQFLQQVEKLSGTSVPMRTRQTIQASEAGKHFAAVAHGRAMTAAEVESHGFAADRDRDFLLLEEQSLDPRDLGVAMPAAARAAGIRMEQAEVIQVAESGFGLDVATTGGTMAADAFVNCCGAWAQQLLPDERLGVEPVAGQVVVAETATPPELVYRRPDLYLVPRGDGRVVIGATAERKGFLRDQDERAVQSLLAGAAAVYAPLRGAKISETWVGLRPGSADDLPVIGATGRRQFVATGHFRNGILLAPATARVLADLILGEDPPVDLAPFSPWRKRDPEPAHG